MNFHSLAPKKYKRSVVSGMVHRIYRSCSNWKNIHDSLNRAKQILSQNQYPKEFYEPIIHETLTKIIVPPECDNSDKDTCDSNSDQVDEENIGNDSVDSESSGDSVLINMFNIEKKTCLDSLSNIEVNVQSILLRHSISVTHHV